MVSVGDGMTVAELASLEELVQLLVRKRLITEPVINAVYSILTLPTVTESKRRSSVILFSMMSRADHRIVEGRLDGLVRVGLGHVGGGRGKDPLLAQYTFTAIQSIAFVEREEDSFKLPNDNVLFKCIVDFVVSWCYGPEWYHYTYILIHGLGRKR
jgi:hypothetical protein